jgi:hypothetical protein
MPINEVPVSESFQELFKRVTDVEPVQVTDEDGRDTGEQRRDRDTGLPVWQVSVNVKVPGRKADVIHVKVPALDMPDVDDKHPVFGGLRARAWKMLDFQGSASGGLSWTADTVAALEDRPSLARETAASAAKKASPPPPPSSGSAA